MYRTRQSLVRSVTAGLLLAVSGAGSASAQLADVHGSRMEMDIYGNSVVLNSEQNTITLYNAKFAAMREVGGAGWGNEQFDHPSGIWARNGIDVFVADYGNHRIQRFDRTLSFVSSYSTRDRDNPLERFGYPLDVAMSPMGDLFICDGENVRILKVTRGGTVERAFGDYGAGEGRLRAPTRIEIGPRDNVYVMDGDRIMVYDTFGNFLGVLYADLLRHPSCIFADAEGILVIDSGTLYSFDAQQRPGASLLVSAFTQHPDLHIASISARNGDLYLLTDKGVFKTPDPRSGKARLLDKE